MSAPHDPRDYPPGTIGILTANLSRYSQFHKSQEAMLRPAGTQTLYVEGLWTANALNRLIGAMHPEAGWMCVLPDDHRFAPDMLLRLLAHQRDVIAPLCVLRSPPFRPSLFHEVAPDQYAFYTWKELAGVRGVIAPDTMGGAGVVISRRTLDAVGPPWFTGLAGEHPQEDLSTFARWREAGFQPYVDLETRMEHLTAMSVCPEPLDEGTWGIRIWSNTDLCMLPAYDPSEALLRESESK